MRGVGVGNYIKPYTDEPLEPFRVSPEPKLADPRHLE